MERKLITVSLDGAQAGALKAVFSTFNTVDLDGDVTLPGAFQDGAETRLLPAHDWAHYMIGKGVIRADGEKAVFDGQFNLATDAGRNWYESLKFDAEHGKPMQEFSYGYDVLDSSPGQYDGKHVRFLKSLLVHEVSLVTLGAGIGTGTLDIKGLKGDRQSFAELFEYFYANPDEAVAFLDSIKSEHKGAVAVHHTATTDAAWDDAEMRKRTLSGEAASYYRRIYAWENPDEDPKTKGAWVFTHHMVAADGTPGAANETACSTAIGVLNGGRVQSGDSTPWMKDREAIHAHLAAHLKDAGKDPPPLKEATGQIETPEDESGEKFATHAEHVLADVQAFIGRAAGIAALRAKEGRTFSTANMGKLSNIASDMESCCSQLRDLLTQAEPAKSARAERLFLDYQRTLARLNGASL